MDERAEKLEGLKNKLKSVIIQKLCEEREAFKLRNLDRNLAEDLTITKDEVKFLHAQLEEIHIETAEVRHQISVIEICKSSEKIKMDGHLHTLRTHKQGFDRLFNKVREAELQYKEICDKEAEMQEVMMLRQNEVLQKNEEQLQEAKALETECEALERKCAVLKKRNTAIMLQLRRKLVETEDVRRKLLKKHNT